MTKTAGQKTTQAGTPKSVESQFRAVSNPDTEPGVLWRILKNLPVESVRRSIASHPNAPARVVERLSFDWAVSVVVSAVLNPLLGSERLDELATHPEHQVREVVAANTRTPKEKLAQLAEDPDQAVRLAVAKNANADNDILATVFQRSQVSEKTMRDVRNAHPIYLAIVEHPAAGPLLLDQIHKYVTDPEIGTVEVGWTTVGELVVEQISLHPNLAVATLVEMVGYSEWVTRIIAGRLAATPSHLPHYAVCALAVQMAQGGARGDTGGGLRVEVEAILGQGAIPPLEAGPYEVSGYGTVYSVVKPANLSAPMGKLLTGGVRRVR